MTLSAGDRLVLFSDGFSEAKLDQAADDWAVETIAALARSNGNQLAEALAWSAVFAGPQADDITVMDVRVL